MNSGQESSRREHVTVLKIDIRPRQVVNLSCASPTEATANGSPTPIPRVPRQLVWALKKFSERREVPSIEGLESTLGLRARVNSVTHATIKKSA